MPSRSPTWWAIIPSVVNTTASASLQAARAACPRRGMAGRATRASPAMKRNGLLREASQEVPPAPLNSSTGSSGIAAYSSPWPSTNGR